MANNYSLQQNLGQALSGVDPFAKARQIADAQAQPQQQVMDSPFPDLNVQLTLTQPEHQPSFKDMSQPLKEVDFKQLAERFGLMTKGLSSNKEMGSLQLMKRMQQTFGQDFQNHPAFQPIMRAFQQYTPMELGSAVSSGKRTLKALLGGS